LPTETSVRTALRTQQILAHETGVADTIDPLAGSYYVESLTDDLEEEARAIIDEVDERGGMRRAIESQWVQRQIQDVAYERQREIEEGERVIVGVNEFQVDEAPDPDPDLAEVDEADERRQRERLASVRDDRDEEAVEAALGAVREAARDGSNVMYPLVEAVKTYASVGELCDVFREEFGEYQPA
jgi:methylmalonyl-CoA mutase N-terminal domain/subunit